MNRLLILLSLFFWTLATPAFGEEVGSLLLVKGKATIERGSTKLQLDQEGTSLLFQSDQIHTTPFTEAVARLGAREIALEPGKSYLVTKDKLIEQKESSEADPETLRFNRPSKLPGIRLKSVSTVMGARSKIQAEGEEEPKREEEGSDEENPNEPDSQEPQSNEPDAQEPTAQQDPTETEGKAETEEGEPETPGGEVEPGDNMEIFTEPSEKKKEQGFWDGFFGG